MARKFTVNKGIRYAKKLTDRDRLRAGEMTPEEVDKWVRHKEGDTNISLPEDVIPALERKDICITEEEA